VIARVGAVGTFLWLGLGLWAIGVIAVLLVRGVSLASAETSTDAPGRPLGLLFFQIALAFFTVCAVGLMVVAQSTGLLIAVGAGAAATAGPITYNIGYIVGCLTGGKAAELIGGRALALLNVLLVAALLPLIAAAPIPVALASVAIVGGALGGVASATPMIIGTFYGVARIGSIYGKLNIAYGLGGRLAPWIAGILYVRTGGYAPAMYLALATAIVGILAGLTIRGGRHAPERPQTA
jgi:hypothetical protein